jgi:hypothetical protein
MPDTGDLDYQGIRYFVHVGGERIELGQDERLKEDPFKPIQTGREVDHWEAEVTVAGTRRFVAVSTESLEDAADRLAKKLPEDARPPDRTKKAKAADRVSGHARTRSGR